MSDVLTQIARQLTAIAIVAVAGYQISISRLNNKHTFIQTVTLASDPGFTKWKRATKKD